MNWDGEGIKNPFRCRAGGHSFNKQVCHAQKQQSTRKRKKSRSRARENNSGRIIKKMKEDEEQKCHKSVLPSRRAPVALKPWNEELPFLCNYHFSSYLLKRKDWTNMFSIGKNHILAYDWNWLHFLKEILSGEMDHKCINMNNLWHENSCISATRKGLITGMCSRSRISSGALILGLPRYQSSVQSYFCSIRTNCGTFT